MKKIISILKNKEIMGRIVFTLAILLVFRIGSAITIPGVTVKDLDFTENSVFGLMNLLGGGALSTFSIFALGVSPYITSSIIVELLSMDVLPALAELSKQGQTGRKKMEMTTRYLTLLLGAVQAYGIIKTMENSDYITLTMGTSFWDYAYIVTILMAGGMLVMWLGDQITTKGLGNGISVIIFAGIVSSLPSQMTTAFQQWLYYPLMSNVSSRILEGAIRFALYVVAYLLIVCFVVFVELSKRKIPVQHSGKSGSAKMSQASFLPIKINSAGVIPVIFASSIMMAPTVIASFITGADLNAEWLNVFSTTAMTKMPWFNDKVWYMPWGLIIYLILIFAFSFFYSNLQINPEQLSINFYNNGSYIPGIRPGNLPGNETERYVRKVLNRVTFIGASALALIAALPVVLTLTGVLPQQLALGGTGLIIVVGVALELNSQVDGLLAGKSFGEVTSNAKRGY